MRRKFLLPLRVRTLTVRGPAGLARGRCGCVCSLHRSILRDIVGGFCWSQDTLSGSHTARTASNDAWRASAVRHVTSSWLAIDVPQLERALYIYWRRTASGPARRYAGLRGNAAGLVTRDLQAIG